MLAERIQRDVADHDHLVVARLEDDLEVLRPGPRAGPSRSRRTSGPPGRACRAARRGRGPRRWPRGSPAPPSRSGAGRSATAGVRRSSSSSIRRVLRGRRRSAPPAPRGARRSGAGRRPAADGADRDPLHRLGTPPARADDGRRRRRRRAGVGGVAEDLGQLVLVEGLPLDQGGGEPVEGGPVGHEDGAGPVVGLVDEGAHLVVDERREARRRGRRPRGRATASGPPTARGPRTSLIPHSVTIDRATRVARSMSSWAPVVTSPNTSSSARAPAEEHRQLVAQLAAGAQHPVLERQGQGPAEGPAPGDDRHLVDRVGAGAARGRRGRGRPRGRR